MKTSLTLCFLILTFGALFGWRQSELLDDIRKNHRLALADARAMRLSPEDIIRKGLPPLTARGRQDAPDKAAMAKAMANELISWKRAAETGGTQTDHEVGNEIMNRLAYFDPYQMEIVIGKIRASGEIEDKTHLIELSLWLLSFSHPEATLKIRFNSLDSVKMGRLDAAVISNSMTHWAAQSPLDALDWLQNHPDLITGRTKAALFSGVAKRDPEHALGLIDELKLEKDEELSATLAATARTTGQCDALLAALRKLPLKDGDLVKKTLGSLADQVAGNDFEASQAWLESAKLSDQETASFAEGLTYSCMQENTGEWIGWLAGKLPADKLPKKIDPFIKEWAEADYKTAGEWIHSTPDGPVKQAAVTSYARTLARYQPDSAAQWAVSLPDGQERDKLLKDIHSAWQMKDEAAAASFARQHQLDH